MLITVNQVWSKRELNIYSFRYYKRGNSDISFAEPGILTNKTLIERLLCYKLMGAEAQAHAK